MIDIWVEERDRVWYAIACHGERFAATAVERSRAAALAAIARSLPAAAPRRLLDGATPFIEKAALMVEQLEAGNEAVKEYELSEDYLSEEERRVLAAAAAIPIGYVTTYGSIARAAGTIARRVGRLMATNPLYPIVPCHRVVGSDMALVGYGGRRDREALREKLARLRAEARGFSPAELSIEGGTLLLFPVERVIGRAARSGLDAARQLTLFGGPAVSGDETHQVSG